MRSPRRCGPRRTRTARSRSARALQSWGHRSSPQSAPVKPSLHSQRQSRCDRARGVRKRRFTATLQSGPASPRRTTQPVHTRRGRGSVGTGQLAAVFSVKPSSQEQVPLRQRPRSKQSLGQTDSHLILAGEALSSHTHSFSTQRPRHWQLCRHRAPCSPLPQPSWHTQRPSTQRPCSSLQGTGHASLTAVGAQSSLEADAGPVHLPHLPWWCSRWDRASRLQSSPVKPSSHTHWPSDTGRAGDRFPGTRAQSSWAFPAGFRPAAAAFRAEVAAAAAEGPGVHSGHRERIESLTEQGQLAFLASTHKTQI